MRSPSIQRILRSLTLVGVALCAGACGSNGKSGQPPSAASVASAASGAGIIATLPERAEAVASADAWAVQGTKAGGRVGAEQLLAAAVLRERIFRVDHRDADALEAIELYSETARREPSLRCSAATSGALLEGERSGDPGLTFRGVYRAARLPGADAACKQRAQQILDTLAAFRPPPTVLAQIDAQASASAIPPPQPSPFPRPLAARPLRCPTTA